MNRRSFFKSLALIALAGECLLKKPVFAVDAVDAVRDMVVLNPAWTNAPYELVFFNFEKTFWVTEKRIVDENVEQVQPDNQDRCPLRFECNMNPVPPFITIEKDNNPCA